MDIYVFCFLGIIQYKYHNYPASSVTPHITPHTHKTLLTISHLYNISNYVPLHITQNINLETMTNVKRDNAPKDLDNNNNARNAFVLESEMVMERDKKEKKALTTISPRQSMTMS